MERKKRRWFMKRVVAVVLALCMALGLASFTEPLEVQAAGNPSWNSSAYNNSNPFATNGYYGQCTWYAWGRAYEVMGKSLPCRGNAGTWHDVARNAGWSVGSEPRANSIAVWNGGSTGHVAYVESVSGGSVTISEANFRKNYLKTQCWELSVGIQYYDGTQDLTASEMQSRYGTFLGYIYLGAPPTPPTVSEVWIEGENSEGYMIGCKVSGEAVSSVAVTTWINGGGQTDQTWKDMVSFGNGIYKYFVHYSDHYNDSSSTYINVIFAYNSAGQHGGSNGITFTPVKKPEVSDIHIESVSSEGYMIECKVSGEAVSGVSVTTWINGGGQTDQTWKEMESFGNGVYKYFVRYSDHYNDSSSTYYNVIFAYNPAGHGSNEIMFAPINKPEISDIHIADADSDGYTIECKIDSYNMLSDAQVATWTTSNGQDDLQWKDLERQPDGLTYKCYIPYSSHNNEKGSYENLIYAKSITGEESQMIIHCNELHNWNAGSVLKEAKCDDTGLKEYTCTACNETKREEIPAAGHSYSENWHYDEVKHWHIAVCGHDLKSEEAEHDYVDSTTKATTKKDGSIVEKCRKCGKEKSKTVIYAVRNIALSQTSYTYNGKTQKPSVTVKDSKGNVLKNNVDYTVSFPKGMKNVGRYIVTVTLKGNYSGTISETFDIVPKGTSISRVTAKKKGFAVKWKKQKKQTTGYEIAYSTSSKFAKKSTKIINAGKSGATSKTVLKLKVKKKYYVRIRTYKTVKINGKSVKLCSDWSKAKAVTTKK